MFFPRFNFAHNLLNYKSDEISAIELQLAKNADEAIVEETDHWNH